MVLVKKEKRSLFFSYVKDKTFHYNYWGRTFGSKASIPERKASCAAAKATRRLRRICTCSCLKSLDMKAKKKIGLRSITIRCFCEMVAKHLARRSHLFAFCGFQAILSSTHLSYPLPLLCTKLGEKKDAFVVVL